MNKCVSIAIDDNYMQVDMLQANGKIKEKGSFDEEIVISASQWQHWDVIHSVGWETKNCEID